MCFWTTLHTLALRPFWTKFKTYTKHEMVGKNSVPEWLKKTKQQISCHSQSNSNTSPIHTAVWLRGPCDNSPPPLLCECLRGGEWENFAQMLIRSTGELNQCDWISRCCVSRACRSDGLITAQVPHSTKYREMSDKVMLHDQTEVT